MGTVTDFAKDGANKGLFVSGTGDFFIGKEDGDFIHFDASAGTIAVSSSDLQIEVDDLKITASQIDMSTTEFEFDAIVSDPPYGISTTTAGEEINNLMRRTMDAFSKSTEKGKRIVMAVSNPKIIPIIKEK